MSYRENRTYGSYRSQISHARKVQARRSSHAKAIDRCLKKMAQEISFYLSSFHFSAIFSEFLPYSFQHLADQKDLRLTDNPNI